MSKTVNPKNMSKVDRLGTKEGKKEKRKMEKTQDTEQADHYSSSNANPQPLRSRYKTIPSSGPNGGSLAARLHCLNNLTSSSAKAPTTECNTP